MSLGGNLGSGGFYGGGGLGPAGPYGTGPAAVVVPW